MKTKTTILPTALGFAAGFLVSVAKITATTLDIGTTNTISPVGSVIVAGEENSISSGDDSFIGAGYENSISSGSYCFIGAGEENFISVEEGAFIGGGQRNKIFDPGNYSFIGGGIANSITARGCVIGGGWNNSVEGFYSVIAGGYRNTNSALMGSVGGGYWNVATGPLATIPGGVYGFAPLYGQVAHSSGGFVLLGQALGQAQASEFILRNGSSSANATELFLNGGDVGADQLAMSPKRIIIPTNAAWAFDIMVVARNANGDCGAFRTNGVVKNVSGTVSLVGVPGGETEVPPIARDVNTWSVKVAADNANKALGIFVSGASSTNRWVATIRTTELIH